MDKLMRKLGLIGVLAGLSFFGGLRNSRGQSAEERLQTLRNQATTHRSAAMAVRNLGIGRSDPSVQASVNFLSSTFEGYAAEAEDKAIVEQINNNVHEIVNKPQEEPQSLNDQYTQINSRDDKEGPRYPHNLLEEDEKFFPCKNWIDINGDGCWGNNYNSIEEIESPGQSEFERDESFCICLEFFNRTHRVITYRLIRQDGKCMKRGSIIPKSSDFYYAIKVEPNELPLGVYDTDISIDGKPRKGIKCQFEVKQ
jgi:hypothetical protein